MSKFVTVIAVDVAAVLELLPKRAMPLDVRFNPETSQVEVEWDDDDFETGFTFPFEFPRAALQAKRLPKGVRLRAGAAPEPGAAGRKFALAKAPAQELPGGPTTAITREAIPTQGAEPVDAGRGVRGKGERT